MPSTVEEYDTIAHDPTQLTLGSFAGDRGPYPGHPADEEAGAGTTSAATWGSRVSYSN